jgi:N-acyl homoserine lactone hydrolase
MKSFKEYFRKPTAMRLYVMHTGNVHMAGNIHYNNKSPEFKSKPVDKRFNPVLAYLVEHPKQGSILLDTGVHPSFAEKKTGNFGWLLGNFVKIETAPGRDILSQMKTIGKSAEDIRCVVLSHLHLDHPGGLPALRGKVTPPVYVAREELDKAESSFSLFEGYIGRHLSGFELRAIPFHDGVAPFDQGFDLFGDGSIIIVKTPGHTPGHVSVMLNMRERPVFLTFDAAHRQSNVAEGIPPKGDYARGKDTVLRIKRLMELYPDMMTLYGHDPDQVKDLKTIPQYYS